MTDPTHTEIESLLGVYALDAVSSDEARRVEAHLAQCATCAAEVAGHREVAASLAHSYEEPPDGLWSRISAEIEPPAEMPEELSRRVGQLTPDRRRTWPVLAAAAAFVIVALLGGVALQQGSRIDELENLASPSMRDLADAAVGDPDARTIEMVGGDGVSVPIVIDPDGRAFVFADELPDLPDDRTYQLWGISDDKVVSLGLLGTDVAAFTLPAGVGRLAITEEAAGGVVQSSQDPVVTGAVSN